MSPFLVLILFLTIFLVLHSLHTDIHDKKHSVAQYKGGRVWHGIVIFKDFFFF